MTRERREVRSWKDLLDRCLADQQRFRRMLVLIAVVAAVALGLLCASSWLTNDAWTPPRYR